MTSEFRFYFAVLALCQLAHVVHLSWWWVTAPLWIPLVLKVVLRMVLHVVKLGVAVKAAKTEVLPSVP